MTIICADNQTAVIKTRRLLMFHQLAFAAGEKIATPLALLASLEKLLQKRAVNVLSHKFRDCVCFDKYIYTQLHFFIKKNIKDKFPS